MIYDRLRLLETFQHLKGYDLEEFERLDEVYSDLSMRADYIFKYKYFLQDNFINSHDNNYEACQAIEVRKNYYKDNHNIYFKLESKNNLWPDPQRKYRSDDDTRSDDQYLEEFAKYIPLKEGKFYVHRDCYNFCRINRDGKTFLQIFDREVGPKEIQINYVTTDSNKEYYVAIPSTCEYYTFDKSTQSWDQPKDIFAVKARTEAGRVITPETVKSLKNTLTSDKINVLPQNAQDISTLSSSYLTSQLKEKVVPSGIFFTEISDSALDSLGIYMKENEEYRFYRHGNAIKYEGNSISVNKCLQDLRKSSSNNTSVLEEVLTQSGYIRITDIKRALQNKDIFEYHWKKLQDDYWINLTKKTYFNFDSLKKGSLQGLAKNNLNVDYIELLRIILPIIDDIIINKSQATKIKDSLSSDVLRKTFGNEELQNEFDNALRGLQKAQKSNLSWKYWKVHKHLFMPIPLTEAIKDNSTDLYNMKSDNRFWWKCPKCSYIYPATLSHRKNDMSRCPICSRPIGTSGGEQVTYYLIDKYFKSDPTKNIKVKNSDWDELINKTTGRKLELDISITDNDCIAVKVAVEFDSGFHKENEDKIKNAATKDKQIALFRIFDTDQHQGEYNDDGMNITFNHGYKNKDGDLTESYRKAIESLIGKICEKLDMDFNKRILKNIFKDSSLKSQITKAENKVKGEDSKCSIAKNTNQQECIDYWKTDARSDYYMNGDSVGESLNKKIN